MRPRAASLRGAAALKSPVHRILSKVDTLSIFVKKGVVEFYP
jgi:hypothetical protein